MSCVMKLRKLKSKDDGVPFSTLGLGDTFTFMHSGFTSVNMKIKTDSAIVIADVNAREFSIIDCKSLSSLVYNVNKFILVEIE